MVEAFKRYIDVRPARRTGIGHDVKPADADEQITELVENGDTIGATRMVRSEYGMALTEARQFVGELQSKSARPVEEEAGNTM